MKNRPNNTNRLHLSGMQRALILIVALITAIAISVTCAVCFNTFSPASSVDNVEQEVTTSANRGTLTGDQSAPGKLNNGDVITYAYTGGVQSITLPIGEFQFIVNGAAGGNGYSAYAAAAGKGGRTTATIKLTAVTTIYIVVGGKGANFPGSSKGTASGGYNGGGNAKSNRTCGHGGGGGGGATHIATATGTLSSLSGNTGAILIVAGGGGGAGNANSTSYYGGGGGGAKTGGSGVVAGGNAGLYANGGQTTTGGTCSGTNPGGAGSFGVGGTSTGKSNYSGGAGGGGGYYGGAGGAGPSTCNCYGGGGGASYVKSTMTSAVYERGVSTNTGNGSATINVINVNQKPVSAGKSYSINRSGGSTVVNAREIATDPDATKTNLFFTDGVAGSLTTLTKNASTGLYLNSACTTSASKYLTWEWTSDYQITVKSVKLYPRNGIDGCTLNGRLTLYAKVRDSYANTPAQYEWNTVSFTFTVTPQALGQRSTTTTGVEVTGGSADNSYYIGMSKRNAISSTETSLSKDNLYNPNGTTRYTVNIKAPLQKDVPFVIKASDLMTNVNSLDMAVIALNSTTQITGNNPKFIIQEYDRTASLTDTIKPIIYNKSKVQVANAFTQITLICKTPDPEYQVLSVTLYAVEKNTAYTTEKNVSADVNPITLDIVFKMDNNRPTVVNTVNPTVTLTPMTATNVNISSFYNDADTGTLTASTHYIRAVKVPETEFIQLDKYGNVVSTVSGGASYFNVVPSGATASSSSFTDSNTPANNSLTSGTLVGGGFSTGFQDWYISNGASNSAFVQYSFSNMTLSLTGLRATYNMYRPERTAGGAGGKGKSITGGSTGAPTTTDVTINNPGHFYVLLNIVDRNDTNDAGIWLPLGIIVSNKAPTTTNIERNGSGASEMPTASGVASDSSIFYFTPMGITVDRKTYPLGVYATGTDANNKIKTSSTNLQPLASDSDNYYTTSLTYDSKLNELVQITSTIEAIYDSVIKNDVTTAQKYFKAEFIDIYVPTTYFGGRVQTANVVDSTGKSNQTVTVDIGGSDVLCVKLKGIKITLKNYTHNRYLFANVALRDSSNAVVANGANIAINVTNTAPTNNNSENVATINYKDDGKTVTSSYTVRDGFAEITYNMPVNSSALISPYDLLWDGNLTADGINYPTDSNNLSADTTNHAFTLNGLSGTFINGQFSVDDKSTGSGRKIDGLAAPVKATNANGDYSSETYKANLKNTIALLNETRNFGTLSSTNMFGGALETVKPTYVDGLFFARTTDSSNLDGYLFDPYKADASKYETPSIVGGSYISYSWGSKIRFADSNGNYTTANTYNLDYIVITALSRTQVAPVEIELNVRDRIGAGASGSAQGISKIKIVINIINSAPKVQYERIYTLSTSPIQTGTLNNAQELPYGSDGKTTIAQPSTIIFRSGASVNKEDRYKDFLTDNEGDGIMFYTTNPVRVLDALTNGSDADGAGNKYLGSYIDVTLTSETLTITALNSSQNINTLYVFFDVTDGRSSDGRTLDSSTCYIRVQVINAPITVNTGDNGFDEVGDRSYQWTVETVNNSDITRTRYFASSDDAVAALTNGETMQTASLSVATAGQIKILSTDTDILQRPILQVRDSALSYQRATVTDFATMKNFVPTVGFDAHSAVRLMIGDKSTNVGAVGTYVSNYDVIYFVNGTAYKASELAAKDAAWWQTNDMWESFFDSQGRWIVGDWAISITPRTYSTDDSYITVVPALRDETVFGGDTAGSNTAYKDGNDKQAVVSISNENHFHLYVQSMGIIPYTYYNQFGGYYVVADYDGTKNYISTYDGTQTSVYDADQANLYLNGSNQIVTSSGTELKTRAQGEADQTNAGIHSGEVYVPGKEYAYQTADTIAANNNAEVAFKYSDTINVAANKSYTYVPMSYFAMRPSYTEVEDNELKFTQSSFVAYDLGFLENSTTAYQYQLNSDNIYKALTLTDNKGGKWTGETLNQNPYVTFTRYTKDSAEFMTTLNSPYFNNGLAIPSVNENGALSIFSTGTYKNNLIGPEGRLLYLQGHQQNLIENTFGIGLAKKSTRSSESSLTLTVKVAECQYVGATSNVQRASNSTSTGEGGKTVSNTATLSFKIEIGNAAVDLVTAGNERDGVVSSDNGYHTRLDLTTGGAAKSIQLVRDGTSITNADDVINVKFKDDDVVRNADNSINTSLSDNAYFYTESLTPMSTLGGARAREHTVVGDTVVFTNAIDATSSPAAQNSLRNYFGSRNATTYAFSKASATNLDFVNFETTEDEDSGETKYAFQPNGGIYGTNMGGHSLEGYSKFFRTSVSPDGTRLTITPLAKTTLNAEMTTDKGLSGDALKQYYNERGLEYVAATTGGVGYYPLKILIYDSHGDGPEQGSFVSLEVRVYISGSEPTLSSNLENDTSISGSTGNKKITVQLPVGSTYQFSLTDVISSNSLLSKSDDQGSGSFDWYWKSDYTTLVNKVSAVQGGMYSDRFRADTGTYLKSPFEGWSATTNSQLVNGTAKFSDGNKIKTALGSLPDVIMYMEYDDTATPALSANSKPMSNTIQIRVNRRTTYLGQSYKNFKFSLTFTDNENHTTKTLTIYVEVVNQAPTIRTSASHDKAQELKMRVGDYFTIVTTPYDRFLGAETGITLSDSAKNSTSYGMLQTPRNISQRNLCMAAGDAGFTSSTVQYKNLTEANLNKEYSENASNRGYKLHDYVPDNGALQNLGYLAVADDDTPWGLRIERVQYYDSSCFNVARQCDLMPDEGRASGGTLRPLDVVVVAARVCTKMPITITVIDGDGARATFTMYVTVESSSPVAIAEGDKDHNLCSALNTVGSTAGVYETYMSAYNATGNNVHERVSVSLDGGDNYVSKTLYGEFTVNINEIAYDPDVEDNNNIAMYCPSNEYDAFMLNGMPLTKIGLHYYNDIYDIQITDNTYQSFRVRCLTYNPDRDSDELTFYVRDCGNNVFQNAIPITIKLHTFYSSMTNDWQYASSKITPQGQFNSNLRNVIDTVYVKGYDDYTGVSAYVKELTEKENELIVKEELKEEDRTRIAGVDSTYQFLNYGGMKASVDQDEATDKSWGINDSDVINRKANATVTELPYNLNYDVRVYAFMKMNEADNTVYDPLSLTEAAQLLDISNTQYNNHYIWLKESVLNSARQNYLVGGISAVGSTYTVNKSLLMFINKYFVFDIGEDGVSLTLRPVTSNINTDILMYVEIEKQVSDRSYKTRDAAIKSGSIFYVKVKDSAPTVNTNSSVLEFSGKVGEYHDFPIFDKTNPFASMFNDSDVEDTVRVNGFISSGNTNNDYAEALADADCDWQAAPGKDRAIEITINNDDVPSASGIPAHSLRIKVLRRIDKRNSDGSYANEVKFPVNIWGLDKSNEKIRATLYITIQNSDIAFNTEQLEKSARFFDANGVGYEIYVPETVDEKAEKYSYAIDVKVAPNEGALNVNLVADHWFADPDFTSSAADTDSFRLIKPASATNENFYVVNGALQVKNASGEESIATITPIYGNNGVNVDPYHFMGFSVVANSHTRNIEGAAYIRVIDRSGTGENTEDAGITIRINVQVLNAAPTVKSKDIQKFSVIGSDTKDGDPIIIKVSDYVEDVNGSDKLYIVGMLPIKTDDMDIHCTIGTDNGGNIVNVELVDGSIDQLRIIPRKGFYGTQDVSIVVSDGDLMNDPDARTVSFSVRVTSIYDINNVIDLNRVNAIRSIPTKVTSEMLFNEVTDTYDNTLSIGTGDGSPSAVALASDDEEKTFNPGRDYVITGLSTISPDVTIGLDNDGDWSFVCTREIESVSFDVTFVKRTDIENGVENPTTYTRQFPVTVGKNHAPTLLDNFTRATGYTFYTRESDYGLDGNGTIALTTGMLFTDLDLELGDRLLFDPNAMSVTSPTMVSLRVSDDRTILYLTYNYKGETDLTIGVVDRTGETTKATIHVKNVDRPSAPFMSLVKISVETYPYIWLGVGIGILLLILLIILLIVLLKRRKRKREELEAVLISELELEEQMLRIANTSNAMYQSFGYLPPTMPQQADPGLMIGGGSAAPNNNVIGLNPGDNGVSNDSDM
ncbi:MAG: hypothetical protein HDT28_06650 [Clostridiales bacterium]|nr:hypothetical protein [Clostridiales bacterium]